MQQIELKLTFRISLANNSRDIAKIIAIKQSLHIQLCHWINDPIFLQTHEKPRFVDRSATTKNFHTNFSPIVNCRHG
jgi:hypothetical protein